MPQPTIQQEIPKMAEVMRKVSMKVKARIANSTQNTPPKITAKIPPTIFAPVPDASVTMSSQNESKQPKNMRWTACTMASQSRQSLLYSPVPLLASCSNVTIISIVWTMRKPHRTAPASTRTHPTPEQHWRQREGDTHRGRQHSVQQPSGFSGQ